MRLYHVHIVESKLACQNSISEVLKDKEYLCTIHVIDSLVNLYIPYLLDYTLPLNKRPPPSSGDKLLRRVFMS